MKAKVKIVDGEEKKSMSVVETFWDIIGLKGFIYAGKHLLFLILCAMAILFWLQFVSEFDYQGAVTKNVLYSITPLMPIYLSYKNMEEIGFLTWRKT